MGCYFEWVQDPPRFLERATKRYGDISSWQMPSERAFLLAHPDDVRDVLVTRARCFSKGRLLHRMRMLLGEGLLTSEGDFHLRQRRLVQPAFHKQRLRQYAQIMIDDTAQAVAGWREGQSLDFAREMMKLTLSIVTHSLFGSEVAAEADEVGVAVSEALNSYRILLLPIAHRLLNTPLPAARKFRHGRERLDRIVYRIIDERLKTGEDRGDLLSLLLSARDQEGDGGGLSRTQLHDEILTLFLAGHETTANALAWTAWWLAQHPHVLERLEAELDAVLGGRAPVPEDFGKLEYCNRVFTESMRLRPPAWGIGRLSLEPYEVRGYTIPPGNLVIVSPWVTQRDPRWYDEPETFDPDRWKPEIADKLPKFAYFPFGGGNRLCIGDGFARMEGPLVLATILQHWRLALEPEQTVDHQALITLRPRHGIRMRLERRRAAVPAG
jgi:cytochrome P450